MQVLLTEVLFINNIIYINEIQFLVIVSVKCTDIWHMMPCNLIERYQYVGRGFKLVGYSAIISYVIPTVSNDHRACGFRDCLTLYMKAL